jgi:hypothetical protein
MEKGLCKYSISSFVQYGIMLCTGKNAVEDIDHASRIGEAAMSCSKTQYRTTEQFPRLSFLYCTIVAPYTEPLLWCG